MISGETKLKGAYIIELEKYVLMDFAQGFQFPGDKSEIIYLSQKCIHLPLKQGFNIMTPPFQSNGQRRFQ